MKKLLAFSLLFALSAANAQAAGWLNPYVGIDYAIPTPVTAIIPTRLSKTKPILTSCPPASKFCPDWRSKASISSLPMKKTPRQTLSFPETASKPICRCALTALTSSTTF